MHDWLLLLYNWPQKTYGLLQKGPNPIHWLKVNSMNQWCGYVFVLMPAIQMGQLSHLFQHRTCVPAIYMDSLEFVHYESEWLYYTWLLWFKCQTLFYASCVNCYITHCLALYIVYSPWLKLLSFSLKKKKSHHIQSSWHVSFILLAFHLWVS